MNRKRALQILFAGLALAFVCEIMIDELAHAAENIGSNFLFHFIVDRWAVALFGLTALYGAYRLVLIRKPD
jgi:hypothetical protein